MAVSEEYALKEGGQLDLFLQEVGLPWDTLRGNVKLALDKEHKHENLEGLAEILKETGDLPSGEIERFMFYIFGEVAKCDYEALVKSPRFFAGQKERFEKALAEALEYTTITRAQYDAMESCIFNFMKSNMAPRKVRRFKREMQKFFENQPKDPENEDFEELGEEDLEIFGQLDFLVQQGPQSAILAVADDWNHAHEIYHPVQPYESLPRKGEQIAHCFWGPVKRHRLENGKFIVSKQISLAKLRRNLNARQRFNDYPPNEIATHRFLCEHFRNAPDVLNPCPFIVDLKGVTKHEESHVHYYMEFGLDYFSQISENHDKYLKKWKKALRAQQLGRSYIKTHKSPWEIERCNDFIKLARGMYFMHRLGVAHRDFKLENTIMGLDGNVKIIDFGVAHRFGLWEKHMRVKDRVGTATYMSPECSWATKDRKGDMKIQLEQYDFWDAKANDIWTLGIALFMMLFACPPYDSCSNADNRFVYLTEGSYIPSDQKSTKPRNASLRALVKAYRRLDMVTECALEFLAAFFRPESQRITWEQIWSHPWLQQQLEQMQQRGRGTN